MTRRENVLKNEEEEEEERELRDEAKQTRGPELRENLDLFL